MKILLSAGHGGTDPGAIGSGYRERDLTRAITTAQQKALVAEGHSVTVLPYETNEFDEALKTNFKGYDLVISNHVNSASASATGYETWISASYPTSSASVAKTVNDAYVSATGLKNRGVKSEDWRVVYLAGKAGSPAILIEHGFISNSADMFAMTKNIDSGAKAMALALSGKTAPAAPSPTAEKIVSRWNETGRVQMSTTGPVYAQPNSQGVSPIVAYDKGEVLNKYIECVKTDKYLYLKYDRSSGGQGYLRYRPINTDGSYGAAVGSIIDEIASEKIMKRYPQKGSVQNMVRRVPVYAQPNSQGTIPVVWYEVGETLKAYEEVVETDKFVYVKYTRSSGGHGYLQLRAKDGSTYGKPAGKVV